MDLYLFISMLSVIYSRILCTVQSAPAAAETSAASAVHVRTKRCSCATFLDKECVYFCHLDIIWVNTPERVVSYGLGNAPRTKRALLDSMATSSTSGSGGSSSSSSSSGHRCVCLRENDDTCRNFCRRRSDETSVDSVIRSAGGDGCTETQCKHKLAADTGRIKRMKKKSSSSSNKKQVSPPAFRIASKTRLLLEKWRARRRHRARAWEGESAAS